MSTTLARSARSLVAIAAAATLMLVAMGAEARAASTVTITGNAYAFIFGGNVDRLEGATIGIEELPGLTTTAGPNGAYAIEVPDDTTITPYAKIAGYYPTHLQTFHTSGQDLTQVNFQMPALSTYELLIGYIRSLGGDAVVEQNPDGTLKKCAIVSTFFQKEGRSFTDFDDFHDFRPHGVVGSTATATPTAGVQLYFDEDVLPSLIQESSSRDGGVLWADVDSGLYQIRGYSDTTRHASFMATCRPGWLVNANPPWGLHELAGTEAVNPAVLPDTRLNARVRSSRVARSGNRRILKVRTSSTENVTAAVRLRQARKGQKKLEIKRTVKLQTGMQDTTIKLPRSFARGRASLRVVLTDTAGNAETTSSGVVVPRPRR